MELALWTHGDVQVIIQDSDTLKPNQARVIGCIEYIWLRKKCVTVISETFGELLCKHPKNLTIGIILFVFYMLHYWSNITLLHYRTCSAAL